MHLNIVIYLDGIIYFPEMQTFDEYMQLINVLPQANEVPMIILGVKELPRYAHVEIELFSNLNKASQSVF